MGNLQESVKNSMAFDNLKTTGRVVIDNMRDYMAGYELQQVFTVRDLGIKFEINFLYLGQEYIMRLETFLDQAGKVNNMLCLTTDWVASEQDIKEIYRQCFAPETVITKKELSPEFKEAYIKEFIAKAQEQFTNSSLPLPVRWQ